MQNGHASVSDEDLLAALRGDDDRAFAELYRRYARPLVTTAFRKTGDGAVAEDLVHELFLSLWLRRQELEVRQSVRVRPDPSLAHARWVGNPTHRSRSP